MLFVQYSQLNGVFFPRIDSENGKIYKANYLFTFCFEQTSFNLKLCTEKMKNYGHVEWKHTINLWTLLRSFILYRLFFNTDFKYEIYVPPKLIFNINMNTLIVFFFFLHLYVATKNCVFRFFYATALQFIYKIEFQTSESQNILFDFGWSAKVRIKFWIQFEMKNLLVEWQCDCSHSALVHVKMDIGSQTEQMKTFELLYTSFSDSVFIGFVIHTKSYYSLFVHIISFK